MNFNNFIGLVTNPQVAIDAVDLALVFGELDDFSENELAMCIDDVINFHIDVAMGALTPL